MMNSPPQLDTEATGTVVIGTITKALPTPSVGVLKYVMFTNTAGPSDKLYLRFGMAGESAAKSVQMRLAPQRFVILNCMGLEEVTVSGYSGEVYMQPLANQ